MQTRISKCVLFAIDIKSTVVKPICSTDTFNFYLCFSVSSLTTGAFSPLKVHAVFQTGHIITFKLIQNNLSLLSSNCLLFFENYQCKILIIQSSVPKLLLEETLYNLSWPCFDHHTKVTLPSLFAWLIYCTFILTFVLFSIDFLLIFPGTSF